MLFTFLHRIVVMLVHFGLEWRLERGLIPINMHRPVVGGTC